MKNIKNIDRLFQEKFKDFEASPSNETWKNIEIELRKKKNKKRIIPFWFKLSGIAAGLMIAFFVFYNNFDSQKINNSIVIKNEKTNNKTRQNSNNTLENNNAEITLDSNEKSIVNDTKVTNQKFNKNTNSTLNNTKNTIVKIEKTKSKTSKKSTLETKNTADKIVISDENDKQNSNKNSAKLKTKSTINTIVQNKKKQKSSRNKFAEAIVSSNKIASKTKETNINNKTKSNEDFSFNNNSIENETNLINKNISDSIKNIDLVNNIPSDKNILNNNKTKIIEDKKTDSLAIIASKTKNELEELLLQKKSEKKKIIPKTNKWQITSSIAPVFFNSNEKDSPIDPVLNQNSKSFETNLSLGVGMEYAISKKLTIRSGVNKFTMAYATNDIFFRAGLGNPAMKNMTSDNMGAGLEIMGKPAVSISSNEISPQKVSEGIISQKMGYFEVPIEMSYNIVNKKFGIDIIGGFSTLFLTENQISLQSGAMTSSLGKANNLNDVHFSSNVGIGFRYKFWKSFQARLEPTLKYQLNTFTDNSVGFKPYFIGIYSGISFGF